MARMRAHIAAGEGYRLEVQLQAKDGRQFWIDLDVRPTYDGAGARRLRLGPDRGHLRQAARGPAEGHLDLVALGRPPGATGGWEVDLSANVVRWSREVQEMLARPDRVETHAATLAIYPESERDRVRAYIRQAMDTGGRIEFESPMITPHGGDLWFRIVGEPEMVDGKCVAIHGAMQDITAQRQAHAELLESERFGRGVIDGVAAMLTVIDETGAIVAANQAFRSRAPRWSTASSIPWAATSLTWCRGCPATTARPWKGACAASSTARPSPSFAPIRRSAASGSG
uniref:PAS domain-containing protein n=1 Tax=Phenylobacterium glaciei TaxID=2803784 RepID=A0A974S880_9CAUL|nr:PAS domain-containing protein [Phenylobacterium glaciei]